MLKLKPCREQITACDKQAIKFVVMMGIALVMTFAPTLDHYIDELLAMLGIQ